METIVTAATDLYYHDSGCVGNSLQGSQFYHRGKTNMADLH